MDAKSLRNVTGTLAESEALRAVVVCYYAQKEGATERGYSTINLENLYPLVGIDVHGTALGSLIRMSDRWSNDIIDLVENLYRLADGTPEYKAFYEQVTKDAKELLQKYTSNSKLSALDL